MKDHMAFYCVALVLDASERGQLARYFVSSGTKKKWMVMFLTIPANRVITHLASFTYKSKRFTGVINIQRTISIVLYSLTITATYAVEDVCVFYNLFANRAYLVRNGARM